MKIVHILTRLLRAGSEENTLATCKYQVATGHDVYLIHGRDFDPTYYEAPIAGLVLVKVESMVHPVALAQDVRAFRELAKILRRLRPDVVHTHQSKAGILGRFAARAANVPLVIHGVHIVPFSNVGFLQRLLYLMAERMAALTTDAFVDVSRGVRDAYLRAGIGTACDHHVVHSGFDLERFRNAKPPADWRDVLGIAPGQEKPPVVVMLAALEPRKRHCEFLRVFPDLVRHFPDIRLVMPGEGPHRTAVENAIRELGLQDNARLIGYRNDPERIIAMADVCVLVSTREGLPRVVMQYLAVGKPCVVCDMPGLDEVVRHGGNGVVVGADSIADAVGALYRLLSDRHELARLANGAVAADLSSWDVGMMGLRISDIYGKYQVVSSVLP